MSGPINLDAIRAEHKRLLAVHKREITHALSDIGEDARNHAQTQSLGFTLNVPSPTRSATNYTLHLSPRNMRVTVFNPTLVGRVMHSGSKAHAIKARKRKALKFAMGGVDVFRRGVWHPGTKATRWFDHLERHSQDFATKRLAQARQRVEAAFRTYRA